MIRTNGSQQGIALIQVLLIVTILSLLVIFLAETARSQLDIALLAKQRVEAQVELHSSESLLSYELLTRPRHPGAVETGQVFAKNWNFYGRPFSMLNNTEVRLTDASGKLSLNFADCGQISKVLANNGMSAPRATQVCYTLLDWQDNDSLAKGTSQSEREVYGQVLKNALVTDLSELYVMPGLSPDEAAMLENVITLFDVGRLNPYFAPVEVLAGLLDPQRASSLAIRRDAENMTFGAFGVASGIVESEGIWYAPSSNVEVEINIDRDGILLQRQMIWGINPYAVGYDRPINMLRKSGF